MKLFSRILTAAASAALLALTGASAHAAPDAGATTPSGYEGSAELDSYLASLSAEDRDTFVSTRLPASVDVELGEQVPVDSAARASMAAADVSGVAVTPLATGCWTQRATWKPKAAAGNVLYTYHHVVGWCASGSQVTSARVADSGGETKTPGWRYEGITASAAGVVSNQGRSYTQHKFVLGVGGWDVQSPLHCGRGKGGSSGSATFDATCGIY